MKRLSKHSVWIALGVLVALGVWLYFDLKTPVREPDQSPKVSELVGLKPDEVTRVEATSDGKTIVLVKSAASWNIESPVKTPADAETVKRTLEDLLDQSSDFVMEKAPSDLARWGLSAPKKTIVLSGDGKKVVLQIGDQDPGKSSYFTRIADSGRVFLAGSYAVDGFVNKTVNDFRDKTVISVARENMERIILRRASDLTTLVRKDSKWAVTEPVAVPADDFTADGVADAVGSLKAEKFVAENATDLERYGLDKPRLVVEVEAKGGARYGVRIGKDVPGGSTCYAARVADRNVVEISKSTYDSLNKGLKDLRSRKVLDVETDKVEKISVVARDTRWEASKTGDDWKFVQPNAGKKADAIDVDNIILDATASADRWVADNPSEPDLARYGLVKPEITVTLTVKGGATKRLEVGKKSSSGDYFVRGSDTGTSVFAIGSYVVDRLKTVPKVADEKK